MIRFGIIGAGNIANHFCNAVSLIDGAVVTAVASKSKERAEKFAADNKIEAFYGNYEEMLKREDIDIVYIATTMNFHYENILECLKWNKHVMCEKCMVLTYKEAEEVFTIAKKKNLFVMECMWTRFLPKTQKAKQWIDEGKIGNLKLAQGTLGFVAPFDLNARMYSKKLGGGALFDLGVYPIELFSYFTDKELTEIQPMVTYAVTGVDETVNLNLKYGDFYVNLQCSIAAKLPENAYIYGDRGYIVMNKLHYGNNAKLYDLNDNLIEEYNKEEANGFVYEIEEAIACVQKGKLQSDTASHKMTLDCCRIFDYCLKQA